MANTTTITTTDKAPTDAEIKALLKRVSACRTKLMALVPFFGHLALNLKPKVATPENNVPTAAVAPDGTLYLNAGFCATLSDAEMSGLLCHEVMHPALHCWLRQGSRKVVVEGNGQKFSLWNLAHDLSFNPMIKEMSEKCEAKEMIALPKDAALDEQYAGLSAEEIYDKLLSQAKTNPKGGGGGGLKLKIPGGKHGIGDDMRGDLSSTPDGQKADAGDKSAQTKLENDWKVSVVAAAQVHEKEVGQGKMPAGLQKIINELTDPKVDWKTVLSHWIGENGRRSDYSYRRPSRRSESVGEYLPSVQRYGVDDITILWDTSGSMNGRETEILSEVDGICQDLGIGLRIITCDAEVHADVRDVQNAIDAAEHVKGGGGSNFNPAFKILEDENYEGCIIAFTDGYICVPPTQPVLVKGMMWVIGDNDIDPTGGKWGEVLRVNDKGVVHK